jgi:hypothetical protein
VIINLQFYAAYSVESILPKVNPPFSGKLLVDLASVEDLSQFIINYNLKLLIKSQKAGYNISDYTSFSKKILDIICRGFSQFIMNLNTFCHSGSFGDWDIS